MKMCLMLIIACICHSFVASDAYSGGNNPFVMRFFQEKQDPCVPSTVFATCNLTPDPEAPFKLKGVVNLAQTQYCTSIGRLSVKAMVRGFPPSTRRRLRGFHVHQFGDLTAGCGSAGGHYNPFNQTHGAPWDRRRHVGDFGNIPVSRDGRVEFALRDRLASLFGKYSILGRAIVIHAGEDDLGRGGNSESKRTGNAGARLACCVIGRRI